MLIILKDSVTCTPAASILDPLFQTSTWKLLPESYYRAKNGKQKDLQNFIYHLLVIGILTEVPTGTADRPSIVLRTGNINPLTEDNNIMY